MNSARDKGLLQTDTAKKRVSTPVSKFFRYEMKKGVGGTRNREIPKAGSFPNFAGMTTCSCMALSISVVLGF